MHASYIGYVRATRNRIEAQLKAEGCDVAISDDTMTSMYGASQWMGWRVQFCSHGSGPLSDIMRAKDDRHRLHTRNGTWDDKRANKVPGLDPVKYRPCGNYDDVRIAAEVSLWERLVERTGWAERWEARAPGNRWVAFWRRNGRVPEWCQHTPRP